MELLKVFYLFGLLVVLFAVGCSGALCAASEFLLAEKGNAKYTIVKPSAPTRAEITAVDELKYHLDQVTGAEFTVTDESVAPAGPCIYVGHSKYVVDKLGESAIHELGSEGFIIRADNYNIIIGGGNPRGTLYGTYSFLEREVGCRWLNFFGEVFVPKKRKLNVSLTDRREVPSFLVRDLCVQAVPKSINDSAKGFLARNRNQGPDFNFLGDNSFYGGTSHRYVFPPKGWMAHTFYQWLPPAEFFESNPEFYSFHEGKRVKNQLCFASELMRNTLTERIINHVIANNKTGNYSLTAQDIESPLCDCPDCKRMIQQYGAPGAPLFLYLAELGPKLKEACPEAFVTTLAYRKSQTELPPKNLKMPDNIIILFAPIDADFGQSLTHPRNQSTLENLNKWSQIAKHLWIWYYPNPYRYVLPKGNFARMADDFRTFKRLGVEGIFSEHDTGGVYNCVGLVDMQTWVMTKLLWDAEQNLDQLVEDYAYTYYGKAAPYIINYYNLLENARPNMVTRMSWDAPFVQYRFLTRDLLIQAQKILDNAEKRVANDPDTLLKVKQVRMSLDDACILFHDMLSDVMDRGKMIERYKSTYTATKHKYTDPDFTPDKLFEWHSVLTPIKPIKGLPDGVGASKVYWVTAENTLMHSGTYKTVDPEAAAGVAAVTFQCGEDIFEMGFYDQHTKVQTNAKLPKDQIILDGYNLYKIGRAPLNDDCMVWVGKSWFVQFKDLPKFFDPENPGKNYDIYVSLRFEGEAYGSKDPDKQENRAYTDRVVLVPVD